MQFFISYLATWLCTRRFSEPTFGPSRRTNHWKNVGFRDFPNISRTCGIFLLLFTSLLFSFLLLSSVCRFFPLLFISTYCRKFDCQTSFDDVMCFCIQQALPLSTNCLCRGEHMELLQEPMSGADGTSTAFRVELVAHSH